VNLPDKPSGNNQFDPASHVNRLRERNGGAKHLEVKLYNPIFCELSDIPIAIRTLRTLRLVDFLVLIILLFYTNFAFSQNAGNNKFQITYVKPATITETGHNHYFIDFGKDAFGTLVINLNTSVTDTLVIHLGEKILNNFNIDRNPGGTIRYQKVKLAVSPLYHSYTIKLPADKRNTNPPAVALPDSFGVITPFRYCEIENLKVPVNNVAIRQMVYNYSFNESSSSFICSDTILNKIWNLCKYSMKATSFCGVYIDGDRERIPYEADAYINQLSHYSVDNEYSIARRTNKYFISNPTWPTEWILTTVLLFYNDFMYTGDIAPLMENYKALKAKTLIGLEREDGLISSKSDNLTDEFMSKLGFRDNKQRIRDIVDWPPAQKDTGWKLFTPEGERDGYELVPVNTVVNSYHYINLKLMSEIAGWLNKKDDSIYFLRRSQLVRQSVNNNLFDRKNGRYVDGENSNHSSLHANMFPLAFGLVPEEYVKQVVSFIKTKGMACSVYGAQFLLESLYRVNEADYALDLMTSTSGRSWWNMIRSGSTITMEAWDMKYKPNSDLNHAWGAAPANIISREMWGIKPGKPGYSEVIIKPQMSRLSSGKIIVPTRMGQINAEYKEEGNKFSYIIVLPPGMKGEFVLSHKKFGAIFANKTRLKTGAEIIALKAGLNSIEILR
jgi:alpha-L-rhamnosidase